MMEFKSNAKTTVGGHTATLEMASGDYLSIAFKDLTGEYRVVNVNVQGRVMLITDELTDTCLLLRKDGISVEQGKVPLQIL